MVHTDAQTKMGRSEVNPSAKGRNSGHFRARKKIVLKRSAAFGPAEYQESLCATKFPSPRLPPKGRGSMFGSWSAKPGAQSLSRAGRYRPLLLGERRGEGNLGFEDEALNSASRQFLETWH